MCIGQQPMHDNAVGKSSTKREDNTQVETLANRPGDNIQAEDNYAEQSDVEPKPHVSPYDVASGLAMLPKVSTFLLLHQLLLLFLAIRPTARAVDYILVGQ